MNRRATRLAGLSVLVLLLGCSGGAKKIDLSPGEVEEICVHIVSCAHQFNPDSTDTVSGCVNDLMWIGMAEDGAVTFGDVISCMVDAGSDCDALYRCGNEGHGPESCDPATFEDRCDGTTLVTCGSGNVGYFDCSRYDPLYGIAVCVVGTDGDAGCESGRSCTGTSMTCAGNVMEMCIDGTFLRIDCTLIGASCRDVAPGMGTCVGRGANCGEEYSVSCDGHTIVRCLGGREARFDCSVELGPEFTCSPVDADDAECVPRASDCDGETHVDTCDASAITYCRWGRIDHADCVLHGYGSCTEGTSSAFCQ